MILRTVLKQTTNKFIQQNNVNILSKMLIYDIINQSIEEMEKEETEKNKLSSITELITNSSFTETPIKALGRSRRIVEQKKIKKKQQKSDVINKYGRR